MSMLEQQLNEAGDYITHDFMRESVIIAKQPDGSLKGFYNACGHRAQRLSFAPNCGLKRSPQSGRHPFRAPAPCPLCAALEAREYLGLCAKNASQFKQRFVGRSRQSAQNLLCCRRVHRFHYLRYALYPDYSPDWIGSHVRSFAFMGGVPELVVPDNLRAGVTKAHRYEPDINPIY